MLCVLGISLISECEQDSHSQAEDLPSLSPREVLKTGLFYQVRTSYFLTSEVSRLSLSDIFRVPCSLQQPGSKVRRVEIFSRSRVIPGSSYELAEILWFGADYIGQIPC